MKIGTILYDGPLEVTRRNATFIARRAVAHWADRGWFTFDAETKLSQMNPNAGALRALLAHVVPMQQGFQKFDQEKFSLAWEKGAAGGNDRVRLAYDAVWAGLIP